MDAVSRADGSPPVEHVHATLPAATSSHWIIGAVPECGQLEQEHEQSVGLRSVQLQLPQVVHPSSGPGGGGGGPASVLGRPASRGRLASTGVPASTDEDPASNGVPASSLTRQGLSPGVQTESSSVARVHTVPAGHVQSSKHSCVHIGVPAVETQKPVAQSALPLHGPPNG
jgi:hypothetical protein